MQDRSFDLENCPPDELLKRILDVGELMLSSGAGINRVEDTLRRIAAAYGAQADVYVIIYSIVITLNFPGGRYVTQTRRTQDRDDINFARLDKLNSLSRRCCREPYTLEQFDRELDAIRADRTHPWIVYAGYMIGAFSFSVFFGGNFADGLAAALFSLLIVLVQNTLGRYSTNRILYTLVVSAITGLGIGLCCRILPFLNQPMVMIGDIMLLNPGITMINAVSEMMVGNTISGQIRFFESFSWALALAAGFMLGMRMAL